MYTKVPHSREEKKEKEEREAICATFRKSGRKSKGEKKKGGTSPALKGKRGAAVIAFNPIKENKG